MEKQLLADLNKALEEKGVPFSLKPILKNNFTGAEWNYLALVHNRFLEVSAVVIIIVGNEGELSFQDMKTIDIGTHYIARVVEAIDSVCCR